MGSNLEEIDFGISEVVITNCDAKYGSDHQGVFASRNIQKGEVIMKWNASICDYTEEDNKDFLKTKEELFECIKKFPEYKDFLFKYNYMVDYDTYLIPRKWKAKKLDCICGLVNHSCEPNCALIEKNHFISLRNISAGEELTYDYQTLDTEGSFDFGLNCKCGSNKCYGILLFNLYRKDEWLSKYYEYCSTHVKDHINNLKTKWFSSDCYVKRYDSSQKGLTALKSIAKDTLVATFCNSVLPGSHYIRSCSKPTCYLIDNQVFTAREIRAGEELTLDYSKLSAFSSP